MSKPEIWIYQLLSVSAVYLIMCMVLLSRSIKLTRGNVEIRDKALFHAYFFLLMNLQPSSDYYVGYHQIQLHIAHVSMNP